MQFITKDIPLQRYNSTSSIVGGVSYSSTSTITGSYVEKKYVELATQQNTILAGIIRQYTSTAGTHSTVTGDTAVYFIQPTANTNNGWIFKTGNNNVASVDNKGIINSKELNLINSANTVNLKVEQDGNLIIENSNTNQIPTIQGQLNNIYSPLLINPFGGNVAIASLNDSQYKLDVNGVTRSNGINLSDGINNINLTTDSRNKLLVNGNEIISNNQSFNTINATGATISGNLTVAGNIYQSGATYQTHTEQLYTEKDTIILRDGASTGLISNNYAGLLFKKYDGVNDGNIVIDKDGWLHIGDTGELQKVATIEESTNDGYFMKYNSTANKLIGVDQSTLSVGNADTIDGYHATSFVRKNEDATIQGLYNFINESLKLPGHYYHNTYSGSANEVYQHFYPNAGYAGVTYTNANLRVSDGAGSFKNFRIEGGTGLLTWAGNKIYHAGNCGSGSGLDADKVDGIESNRILFGDNSTKTGYVPSFNVPLASGFYNKDNAVGAPTNDWYHLLNQRHTNESNNYAMQIAGNFFNENDLYYRIIRDNAPTTWRRIWHAGNSNNSSVDWTAKNINAAVANFSTNGANALGVNAGANSWIANFTSDGTLAMALRGGESGRDLALYNAYGLKLYSDEGATIKVAFDGSGCSYFAGKMSIDNQIAGSKGIEINSLNRGLYVTSGQDGIYVNSTEGIGVDAVTNATNEYCVAVRGVANDVGVGGYFASNGGGYAALFPVGYVGIGTDSPLSILDISNKIKFYDSILPNTSSSTKMGMTFQNVVTSGLIIENDSGNDLLSYAINVPQIGNRDTSKYGGIFRLDTRTAYKNFSVIGYKPNDQTGYEWMTLGLDNGLATFKGQVKSTLPTGTAPLTVASATKVDNLNADKVDGFDIWVGTQAQYNALSGSTSSTTIYLIQ